MLHTFLSFWGYFFLVLLGAIVVYFGTIILAAIVTFFIMVVFSFIMFLIVTLLSFVIRTMYYLNMVDVGDKIVQIKEQCIYLVEQFGFKGMFV